MYENCQRSIRRHTEQGGGEKSPEDKLCLLLVLRSSHHDLLCVKRGAVRAVANRVRAIGREREGPLYYAAARRDAGHVEDSAPARERLDGEGDAVLACAYHPAVEG